MSHTVCTRHDVPESALPSYANPCPGFLSSSALLATAGGENGFNQAIELSADTLANVKFVQEKRLISK